ncbi:hypothetical protein KP509_24G019000 [Ceratopteris richardii]|uniref:Uncharacterized protein n=1 Tax=Ceratopteris richardii TaxID=49495 RepID=A0A8T2RT00_CERRI|nr:hypothetical protein KP509_24G019000 [Ceratopteris richardii]
MPSCIKTAKIQEILSVPISVSPLTLVFFWWRRLCLCFLQLTHHFSKGLCYCGQHFISSNQSPRLALRPFFSSSYLYKAFGISSLAGSSCSTPACVGKQRFGGSGYYALHCTAALSIMPFIVQLHFQLIQA